MIGIISLVLACSTSDPQPVTAREVASHSLRIVYTGNVHGEIEPCG